MSTGKARTNHNARRRNAFATVGTWVDRAFGRRALATLDERMLRDFGMSPSDRDIECHKPFWKS